MASAAGRRSMRKLSDAAPPGCDPLSDNCLTNQPVLILDGLHAGRRGRTARPFDPNDGNKSSRAFLSAGVTHKTLPPQHSVVTLPGDENIQTVDIVMHYSSIHLVNQELQTYLERANQRIPDVSAVRTLGHCLVEGNGGIGGDLANGAFWLGYGSSLEDPYCEAFTKYTMGQSSTYPKDPPMGLETMADVEAWFTRFYG